MSVCLSVCLFVCLFVGCPGFVLESPSQLYLWFGNGCSKEERDFTKKIFRKIDNIQCPLMPAVVMEGKESQSWWDALGGKGPYAAHPTLQVSTTAYLGAWVRCLSAVPGCGVRCVVCFRWGRRGATLCSVRCALCYVLCALCSAICLRGRTQRCRRGGCVLSLCCDGVLYLYTDL